MVALNSSTLLSIHEQDIIHQQTIRHSSHQNGIAERMFYTLLDSVHAILYSSDLPRIHWDSAASTRNLCPTSASSTIHYQTWHGTAPDYQSLRPFGSRCVYHVDRVDRQYHQLCGSSKLVRVQTAQFLGFAPSAKGYLLLLPDNSTITVRFEQIRFTNSPSTILNPNPAESRRIRKPINYSSAFPAIVASTAASNSPPPACTL